MVENFEKAFPDRIIIGEASFFREYCRKTILTLYGVPVVFVWIGLLLWDQAM